MTLKRIFFISYLFFALLSVGRVQISESAENSWRTPLEVNNIDLLKVMPTLDNGRVKPFDTYARNLLLRFSGKSSLEKIEASRWIARLLFAPQTVVDTKFFLINNPQILEGLGLSSDNKRRYSFAQLQNSFDKIQQLAQAAFKIEVKQRDVLENEILRLYENLQLYSSLSLNFSFAFPHEDFNIKSPELRESLELPLDASAFSFLDMALRAQKLQFIASKLQEIPQTEWIESDYEVLRVVSNMFAWSENYQQLPFKIIPSYFSEDTDWFSPWDSIIYGLRTEEGRQEISQLRDVVSSYYSGDNLSFSLNLKAFNSSIQKRFELKGQELPPITLEVLFTKLNPFFWGELLFGISLLFFLFSFLFKTKMLYSLSLSSLCVATLLQTGGILLRIIILSRPPVSNLYETFIFVSFVSALTGLLIEKMNKKWIGIIIGSIGGLAFSLIATRFSMEGDTLQVLVAVLNSNFWLGTHVISITIGYSGMCVAGIVGHIYLIQSVFRPHDKELLKDTHKILLGTLGFGLTMTFLGTNLGGIWADQSWGRFWGWDPKENGALMIVLWGALLFHLKIGRIVGPIGLAIGSVLGIIVVMWAWFGVNLLNVGLHSYGFTSGLAFKLLLYVVIQILFLILIVPIAKNKLKS